MVLDSILCLLELKCVGPYSNVYVLLCVGLCCVMRCDLLGCFEINVYNLLYHYII